MARLPQEGEHTRAAGTLHHGRGELLFSHHHSESAVDLEGRLRSGKPGAKEATPPASSILPVMCYAE